MPDYLQFGFVPPVPMRDVTDEPFLRSIAEFGAFHRMRQAEILIQGAELSSANGQPQGVRMAAAVGIWQLLGSQFEDLLIFCFAVQSWVAKKRTSRLANEYKQAFIRRKGPQSPDALHNTLQAMTDAEFLQSLGIGEDIAAAIDQGPNSRRELMLALFEKGELVRSLFNKLKHGPQVCTLPVMLAGMPPHPFVCVLFDGATLAQDGGPSVGGATYLYLHDEVEHLRLASTQVRAMAFDLWALASAVHHSLYPGVPRYVPPDLGLAEYSEQVAAIDRRSAQASQF
jgi:hypothetical protein